MKTINSGLVLTILGLSNCKSDWGNSENIPTFPELSNDSSMPYEKAKMMNVQLEGELYDLTVTFHNRGFFIDLGDNNGLRYNDYHFNDGSNHKSYHLSWNNVEYIDYGADKDVDSMAVEGMNDEFEVNSDEVNSTYRSLLDKLNPNNVVIALWERRWRH